MAHAVRVLLIIFGTLSLSGCFNRTVVVFPELDVQVTNRGGVGLADASLTFYAWSNPHRRLDAKATYLGDAGGHISTPEEIDSETVAPLLIHGVAEHHWTFCVTTPGHRTLVVALQDLIPGETLRLTLPLTSGKSRDICDNFSYGSLGSYLEESRADIVAQSDQVRGASEVIE